MHMHIRDKREFQTIVSLQVTQKVIYFMLIANLFRAIDKLVFVDCEFDVCKRGAAQVCLNSQHILLSTSVDTPSLL